MDLERFRAALGRRLGLSFDDAKLGMLEDTLRRRLEATGGAAESYLAHLEAEPAREEIASLAGELTVAETYFFRNADQFRALVEAALPARMEARERERDRSLSLLSAGCASGEEAYSLAIALRERALDPSWGVSITAVDVNPAMLDKARRGRYSSWALRETPPEIQRRWFREEGREVLVADEIRALVRLEERNLIDDDPELWRPDAYDVVLCRNVIMYFLPDVARRVVERVARALAPGGFLFLGHAETLRGVSQSFHLRHTHGAFYYQRKEGAEPRARVAADPPARSLAAFVDGSDGWVDAIRKASQRIEALARAPDPRAPGPEEPARWDLGKALELFERERFADALAVVDGFPPQAARDPDVLLLRAALLTHAGRLAGAEDACRSLLELDELSAGAHYLLALCREGAGDLGAAVEHDQVAAYLDPAFAMARLHLGLLRRRGGEREAARRELEQALALLEREDASRLFLFGGGFGRDALTALCRAEIAACGGGA
jgi:chemotaxis protein methyltransferase CheR